VPDSEPPKSNRVTVVVTNDAGKRVTFTVPRGTEPSRLAVEPEPAPGEPLGYAIAEQRPCERCGGSGCDELTVVLEEALYRRTTQENQP